MSTDPTTSPPPDKAVVGGDPDRPWHLRAWTGMLASGWFRVLWRNRFAVSPRRIPMMLLLSSFSCINSGLSVLQKLRYSRRIAATELTAPPIFVLGHWRSGTTLLHELLVCDPRHTYPSTYACFGPNHFLLTERLLTGLMGFFLPARRPMDNMAVGWEYPQEDEWALCNMGLRSPYLTILFPNQPPQDSAYMDLRDVPGEDRERWKQKLLWFLKCLTVREPKRIVLKTPIHTCRVRTLLELLPDARFVHIVRDPFVVYPSTIHTWQRMYRYHGLQVPRFAGLEEYVLDTFCRMYQAFDEDVSLIPPGHFCEVRYEDLVGDPVTEMRRVYDQIGLDGFEAVHAKLEEYAARSAAYRPNRYQLTPQERDTIATRWRSYIVKYGYAFPPAAA